MELKIIVNIMKKSCISPQSKPHFMKLLLGFEKTAFLKKWKIDEKGAKSVINENDYQKRGQKMGFLEKNGKKVVSPPCFGAFFTKKRRKEGVKVAKPPHNFKFALDN